MLKRIDVNQEIVDLLNRDTPHELKRRRTGGQGGLTYITVGAVVRILNQAFGPMGWSWKVDEQWIEENRPRVDFKTQLRRNPNPDVVPEQCAHVLGTLTVTMIEEDKEGNKSYVVSQKSAHGSKVVLGGSDDGQNLYKSAASDALKKAASYFGIASDLALQEDELNYFKISEVSSAWDDVDKEEYRDVFEQLEKLCDDNGIDADYLNAAVKQWSNGKLVSIEQVGPDDIRNFVRELDEAIAQNG